MDNNYSELVKQLSEQYSGGVISDKSGLVVNHFGCLPSSSSAPLATIAKKAGSIHPDLPKPLVIASFEKQQVFIKEEQDIITSFASNN